MTENSSYKPVTRAELVTGTLGRFDETLSARRITVAPIDTFVMNQTEWWQPRDMHWIRIADMELSHQSNLLRWLRRNAASIREQARQYEMAEFLRATVFFPDDAGIADMDFEPGPEWDAALTDEDWVEATPLFRKLSDVVASAYETEEV